MSTNDITGDSIKTKPASEAFRSNWDNIQWGKKQQLVLDEENPVQIWGGAYVGIVCEECDTPMHPYAYGSESGYCCNGCGWTIDD